MDRQKRFRLLRILGMGMLIVGIFMPWFQLGFEPQSSSIRWSGWEEILDTGSLGIESILKNGPDLYSVLSLLEGVSGIGLIIYCFYNTLAIVRLNNGNRLLSLMLISIGVILLFNSQSAIVGAILFGFWLFMLGLLMSAIVEWLSSTDFAAK